MRKRKYRKPKITRWTSYTDGGFRYGRWDNFGSRYVRSPYNETDDAFYNNSPYHFWKDSVKWRKRKFGR